MKMCLGVQVKGNYKGGRNHLEDLGVDGRTVLEWILGK
jgi:hypothetical protein